MSIQAAKYEPLWIFGEAPREFVRINVDGTVIVTGDVNEAARLFWRAIEDCRIRWLAGREVCPHCNGLGVAAKR